MFVAACLQLTLLTRPEPAFATATTYSYTDYSSVAGYRNWTYRDSLGNPMQWDSANSRWKCTNALDAWCFWGMDLSHPAQDRHVIRRWTAPTRGRATIYGTVQKDNATCGGADGILSYPIVTSSVFSPMVSGTPGAASIVRSCGNTAVASYSVSNVELNAGDTIDFVLHRNMNYSWDATHVLPNVSFEDADAIGDLAPSSSSTSSSVTIGFSGVLQCQYSFGCAYSGAVAPDEYRISALDAPVSTTTLPNYRSGGFTPIPHFSATFTGLAYSTSYRFKVVAYLAGVPYGAARTIVIATAPPPPPTAPPTPTLTVTLGTDRRFQITPAVSDMTGLQDFVIYRQRVGRTIQTTIPTMTSWPQSECQDTFGPDFACTEIVSPNTGSCDFLVSPGAIINCGKYESPARIGVLTRQGSAFSWRPEPEDWWNARSSSYLSDQYPTELVNTQTVADTTVGRKPTAYRYKAVARWNPVSRSPAYSSVTSGPILLPRPTILPGFADTHAHQFANLAHGGRILAGRSGDQFDGTSWFDGSPTWVASQGYYGNATSSALKSCGRTEFGGTGMHSANLPGNPFLLDWVLTNQPEHGPFEGYPNFTGWPTPLSMLHQQMYKTALRRAWQGGLRLEVMLAVNAEVLCKVFASALGSSSLPGDCRDGYSIESQLDAAYRFQDEVDDDCGQPNTSSPWTRRPNSTSLCGWYRIVTTPEAARTVISQGKLAVVLGAEVDRLFGCTRQGVTGAWSGGAPGDWISGLSPESYRCAFDSAPGGLFNPLTAGSLDRLVRVYGARHLFPIHLADNGIGGSAANMTFANVMNERLYGEYQTVEACDPMLGGRTDTSLYTFHHSTDFSGLKYNGFSVAALVGTVLGLTPPPAGYGAGLASNCNTKGLTPVGKDVIRELIKQRVMIDIDHMSNRSHVDVVAISKEIGGYPLVSGHSSLNSVQDTLNNPALGNEGGLSDIELAEVRESGGAVNVNVASERSSRELLFARTSTVPAKNCDHSSMTWAQEYLRAVDRVRTAAVPNDGTPRRTAVRSVGFGSDFNTLSTMPQPRFPDRFPECSATAGQEHQSNPIAYNANLDVPGGPSQNGRGGLDPSLPIEETQAFPGFSAPALARSRLNENGDVFVTLSRQQSQPSNYVTKCLSWTGPLSSVVFAGNCSNDDMSPRNFQFTANPVGGPTPNVTIRPAYDITGVCLTTNGLSPVVASLTPCVGGLLTQQWILRPSGHIVNASTGACLTTIHPGGGGGTAADYGWANVTTAACSDSDPVQFWARGSPFEDYNFTGLSHVGMYPDFIADLKGIGVSNVDLVPLYLSAEGYLQAWERSGWVRPLDLTNFHTGAAGWRVTSVNTPSWNTVSFDDTTWKTEEDLGGFEAQYGLGPWGSGVAGASCWAPSPYGLLDYGVIQGGFPLWSYASWIWNYNSSGDFAAGPSEVYFRKTLEAPAATVKTLYVAADDEWEVYLNGQRLQPFYDNFTTNSGIEVSGSSCSWAIDDDFIAPEQDWRMAMRYVASFSAGTNVVAIKVRNRGGPAGLIVDIK